MKSVRAFTLIELLVVIAIVGVLEENTSRGVRIAWAQYHPTLNHPLRCFINTGTFAPEPDTHRYVITNFLPFLDLLSKD